MIYCQSCKHLYEATCEYGDSIHCKLDNGINYENPVRPFPTYGTEKQLEERNKNNNCKDFVAMNIAEKIWRIL